MDGKEISLDDYKQASRKKSLLLVCLGIALVAIALFSITIGGVHIGMSEVVHYIFHPDSSTKSIVIWDWRIPIAVGAIVIGMALGMAGAVMQCILRNPLSSPYTLGLSNAAAFGASLGILATEQLIPGGFGGAFFTTAMAFTWAMVATGFIILMAKYTSMSPEAMILAGVAISSIFSAAVSAFQYFATDSALASIVYWQFGDLTKLSWDEIYVLISITIACSVYFIYKRWDYNALDAGDETARCLGVNINSTRIVSMVLAAVMTSVAVSFVGVIGFIGLLGPHIVRRVVSSDHRYLLPGSMLVGALILLLSTIVSQNAFSFVMPVGIITSFMGGPLFLVILLRNYRRKGAFRC